MVSSEAVMNLSHEIIMGQGVSLKNVYSKDLYRHCETVAVLGVKLGIVYNFNLQELLDLGVGGLLHDYGKISISKSILNKPSALSDMEFYLIKGHPSQGYRDLKGYGFNKNVLDIILWHHEKLDGNGYPSGISDIPILVQIITVCDMFDAIHSKRSYHDPASIQQTIDVLSNSPGLNQTVVRMLSQNAKTDDAIKEAFVLDNWSGIGGEL